MREAKQTAIETQKPIYEEAACSCIVVFFLLLLLADEGVSQKWFEYYSDGIAPGRGARTGKGVEMN